MLRGFRRSGNQASRDFYWHANCTTSVYKGHNETAIAVLGSVRWSFGGIKPQQILGLGPDTMAMTHEDLLLEMDQILGLRPGTLRGHEKLGELENWDSTALVSFVAVAEGHNGVQISPVQIVGCSTVDDLLRLATVEGSVF
jgi:acyl carrier protein